MLAEKRINLKTRSAGVNILKFASVKLASNITLDIPNSLVYYLLSSVITNVSFQILKSTGNKHKITK